MPSPGKARQAGCCPEVADLIPGNSEVVS